MHQLIILYDGECRLCNGLIWYILRHDKEKKFYFAPYQSKTGHILTNFFWIKKELPNSIIYISHGCVSIKSEAILKILKVMGGFYRIFNIFTIIPVQIRDWVYDRIAKNRILFFGKTCMCSIH